MKNAIGTMMVVACWAAAASAAPVQYGAAVAALSQAGQACGTEDEFTQFYKAKEVVQIVYMHNIGVDMFFRSPLELASGLELRLTPQFPGSEKIEAPMTADYLIVPNLPGAPSRAA